MNDKINIDNISNAFDQKARTMLENHQLPVDESIWNEIEAKMQQRKRRVIPFWFLLSGGVAAVVALLFMLRPLAEQNSSHSFATKYQSNEKNNLLKQSKPASIAAYPQKTAIRVKKALSTTKNQIAINSYSVPSAQIQNDNLSININTATAESTATQTQDTVNQITDDQEVQKTKTVLLATSTPNKTDDNGIKIKNSTNNSTWQLATAFTSSNGAPAVGNGLLYASNPEGREKNTMLSNSVYFDYKNNSASFNRKTYSMPVSVGLLVRKNLDKTISIESGLVYTHLQTKLGNDPQLLPDNQLDLHYLGLPANLVLKIIETKKWEIYLSGGGMIEKGINSEYTVYRFIGNQQNKTVVKSPIEGIQWSLNGAFGASFKISQQFGLFFEPKLSYYFNNNQPTSVRTDKPTIIGITGGLRYSFH